MKTGYITDAEFGRVEVTINPRARRATMRAKDDGLHLTVGLGATEASVRGIIERNRAGLRRLMAEARSQVRFLDFHYEIRTDLLHLRLLPSEDGKNYVVREQGKCDIFLRPGIAFERVQESLGELIVRELRLQAQVILPGRLAALAAEHGFHYQRVGIQRSQSRWGSCSHQDSINLSLYLMTLPSHLVDSVLLHELCHTVHKDHSPAFWALMDKVTGGRAQALREEIKGYGTRL